MFKPIAMVWDKFLVESNLNEETTPGIGLIKAGFVAGAFGAIGLMGSLIEMGADAPGIIPAAEREYRGFTDKLKVTLETARRAREN